MRTLLHVLALIAAAAPAVAEPIGVGAQYDTTHVYVDPEHVDAFAASFLATFGGTSTKQVVLTVTPTASSTSAQLLHTPVGPVSLFGFRTPVPFPFGAERTGYLVRDLDAAVRAARAAGASVVVEPFVDAIGRDAVIQWPGGVNMQLYWHTTAPSYAALERVPENRVYVSPDRADAFTKGFVAFAEGKIVSDDRKASASDVGRSRGSIRRIRIESAFGKLVVLVTDGKLDYPYGREVTGYEVTDLAATLVTAKKAGAKILVDAHVVDDRRAAMVEFPGGYVAEVHERARP